MEFNEINQNILDYLEQLSSENDLTLEQLMKSLGAVTSWMMLLSNVESIEDDTTKLTLLEK